MEKKKAPQLLEHLVGFDHHAHVLDMLKSTRRGNHPKEISGWLSRLFKKGFDDQAVTEHSHNFSHYGVPFRQYLSYFEEAKAKAKREMGHKTIRFGLELNCFFEDGKGHISFDSINDYEGAGPKEMIRHSELAILSIHSIYHTPNGDRPFSYTSSDDFFYCTRDVILECNRIRDIKEIPLILGHPEKEIIKLGFPPITVAQAEELSGLMHKNNIILEVNMAEMREYWHQRYMADGYGRTHLYLSSECQFPLLKAYVKEGIRQEIISRISIGTDIHDFKYAGKIRWNHLRHVADLLSKTRVWCK